ncbi:DUF418 domain-containing protein [Bacillus chungangensis]|uniref:DUF418 domain-containing protein n=1 Tax=Bacillus chungangensis TaxID=587633 RepID=A0ABT9WQZ1_9BACI|nr:DUF418 domain-containing protein [Bacillus chungangensis]MDQ0175705.1 uncharacterized protein [Bacillus chungangensis]
MKRLVLLDILRGFAILGTLGTNIWIFATVGDPSFDSQEIVGWWKTSDGWITMLIGVFTNGKFLSLLTILFGVGLAIKYEKTLEKGMPWPRAYIWSCILLFIEGLIHFLLVFEWDILMSYAITAIIVSFLVKKRNRIIKRIIIILLPIHLLIIGAITWAQWAIFNSYDDKTIEAKLAESSLKSTQVYLEGSWLEQVLYRFEHFLEFRIEAIMVLPMNTILFLLGILLFRAGAFSHHEKGRQIRRKLFKWGMLIGLPLNMLMMADNGFFYHVGRYIFAPVLAIGYIGLFSIILEKGYIKLFTGRLQEVGRTALSCYIMQNIVASVIFYGWGLGLNSINNVWLTLLIWMLISLFLMFFANVWLRKFKQGPVETIWRYAANAPFRA